MRRREFITLLGGTAAAWPLAAHAQQAPARPLIGLLSPLSAAAATRNIAAFRATLRDLGYLEGSTMTLALRYGAGSPERMVSWRANWSRLRPMRLSPALRLGPWRCVTQRGRSRSL
jgi:putative ABC transport system substrate-binding protein